MSRIILAGLTTVTLFAFTIAADGQDLKAAAQRQKIAAEKLTSNVSDAIERSFKQDPADAKAALRAVLDRVRDSQDLLAPDQAKLVQRLQARISAVDRTAREKSVAQNKLPPRDTDRPKSRPPVNDPYGGASGAAKRFVDQAKSTQQTQADLIRQREAGINRINLGIERSGVPTDKDITFPADWKERSERVRRLFGPQLTEKEVKLLKTLNSVMSVKFSDDTKLKQAVGYLTEKTGLTIIVDMASLTELNIDYNDPVAAFEVEKASVRTILKKVLGDKGLTYIIKEGSIQVMTPEKAAKYTVLRSYNVADLVLGDPQMAQMAQMFGPFGAKNLREQNALQLIQLIQQAIEPGYWQPNGPGTITYFDPTKSILIRASAEMHYQLESPGIFGGR